MAAGAQARPALPLAAESAGPFVRPVGKSSLAGDFLHLPFPPVFDRPPRRAPAAAARSTCSTICSASPRTPASLGPFWKAPLRAAHPAHGVELIAPQQPRTAAAALVSMDPGSSSSAELSATQYVILAE
jgi:hypothetical protein